MSSVEKEFEGASAPAYPTQPQQTYVGQNGIVSIPKKTV
jgi:hypothetical protein